MDDTLLLFRNKSHVKLFFDYNRDVLQHDRIKCTFKIANTLPFLDVQIIKTDTEKKPFCTGLGMKFNSAVTSQYKFNLDRAYKINLSYHNLCTEFEKNLDVIFPEWFLCFYG